MSDDQISPADLVAFHLWKAERDERERTRGNYVLTPEGRKEVHELFGPDDWTYCLLVALESAESERDALLADSERYRWLRQNLLKADETRFVFEPSVSAATPESFDAAIDAARANDAPDRRSSDP